MTSAMPQIVTGVADAAVSKNHIVKLVHPGVITREPSDYAVEHCGASGRTEIPFGVSESAAAAADGPVDVVIGGRALVVLGDTVVPGEPLKSDGSGHAIPCTYIVNQHIIGYALEDGVVTDIIAIHVAPQMITLTP